jgi:hypothetical protein
VSRFKTFEIKYFEANFILHQIRKNHEKEMNAREFIKNKEISKNEFYENQKLVQQIFEEEKLKLKEMFSKFSNKKLNINHEISNFNHEKNVMQIKFKNLNENIKICENLKAEYREKLQDLKIMEKKINLKNENISKNSQKWYGKQEQNKLELKNELTQIKNKTLILKTEKKVFDESKEKYLQKNCKMEENFVKQMNQMKTQNFEFKNIYTKFQTYKHHWERERCLIYLEKQNEILKYFQILKNQEEMFNKKISNNEKQFQIEHCEFQKKENNLKKRKKIIKIRIKIWKIKN